MKVESRWCKFYFIVAKRKRSVKFVRLINISVEVINISLVRINVHNLSSTFCKSRLSRGQNGRIAEKTENSGGGETLVWRILINETNYVLEA